MSSTLRGSDRPLTDQYDVAMLDLDGVVYVGPDAVPGVPAALDKARAQGMRLAFVTNNAARPPDVVAEHLTELGVAAEPDEVITSSQAAARYLAERVNPAASVLVVGTVGLTRALEEQGLSPVNEWSAEVVAVVQGYSPSVDWALLAEGAVAINAGAMWVATNVDPTVPSPRGPLPGNGALVAALRCATRAEPIVTGKPDPTMHRETLVRTGATSPIVIGDRLDTDIEGANAVGCPSLLVLSGVTTARDLLSAGPELRPTFLALDASGLLDQHPEPQLDGHRATCGQWTVTVTDHGLELCRADGDGADGGTGSGPEADGATTGAGEDDSVTVDDLDVLRALCAAWWTADGAEPDRAVDRTDGVSVSAAGGDDAAAAALKRLGLSLLA